MLFWILAALAHEPQNFIDLSQRFLPERDYRIHAVRRPSEFAVIAIHGGTLEPGTLELARDIAGEAHSFYAFESRLSPASAWDLHLTSTRYDEPQAQELVRSHRASLSIHGFTEPPPQPFTIYVGGRNEPLRRRVWRSLIQLRRALPDLHVADAPPHFSGRNPRNIMNLAREGGVQLELSEALRTASTPAHLAHLTVALREALRDPPTRPRCSL